MNEWLLRVVAIMFAIACVGSFGTMVAEQMNAPEPDAQGCIPGIHPRHNVFLVDKSDAIPAEDIQRTILTLADVFRATSPGDRFSIYFVGNGSDDFLSEQLSICQPRTGGTIWRKRFRDKVLAEQIEAIRDLEEAWLDHSPILESIEALLNRRQVFDAEEVHLWIVSDLMQNTGVLDFYSDDDRIFPNARNLPAPRLKPQGRLTSVRLLVLESVRHHKKQPHAIEFFMAWLNRYSDREASWEMW